MNVSTCSHRLTQQAMEMHKRKAVESSQTAADLKLHLDKYQAQLKEAQVAVAEKTASLEQEVFKYKRMQVSRCRQHTVSFPYCLPYYHLYDLHYFQCHITFKHFSHLTFIFSLDQSVLYLGSIILCFISRNFLLLLCFVLFPFSAFSLLLPAACRDFLHLGFN